MPAHHLHICTHVTPQCTVEKTLYGYRPNFAGNTVLLVIFAICAVAQLILGIRYRLRWFTFAVVLGCACEALGYVGRLLLHHNPWSDVGFKIQICCIVIAPSFLAAGIYLTLKEMVTFFGADKSRLRPGYYTAIFISCDFASLLFQAAGGGLAATEQQKFVNSGDDLISTGIAFQIGTQFICICLALDFAYQVIRHRRNRVATVDEIEQGHQLPKSFGFYVACSSLAFILIFIRCIYRMPEMARGWGNPLMRQQTAFMVLDGTMIAIACMLLTVAHPGIFFPAMSTKRKASDKAPTPTSEDNAIIEGEKGFQS